MDLLNRRFVGRFEATYPQQPVAPRIGVSVITDIGQPAARVNFLIDTGADHTLIAPRDARALFGDEAYKRINQAPDRTAIGGVGTGASVVERELFLVLQPESGPPLIMARDLWVAVELED